MTRPTPRTTSARLPRSARRRLDRSESTTARTSLLTVPAAFGVRAAGFEPVGDVMGCIAFQTSIEYLGSCGSTRKAAYSDPVVVTPSAGSTYTSYLRQLSGAYRTALDRLRAEAVALNADGVLGIRLEVTQHEHLREVVALGTAVRSTGRVRPDKPFTTDLLGPDVAGLVLAGWVPVELHVAVRVALRHGSRVFAPGVGAVRTGVNAEHVGLTQVRQRAANAVRTTLGSQTNRSRADGALLSALTIDVWERRCLTMEGEDLVALATATGTSVARFAGPSRAAPAPLKIMPLRTGPR